ncbi:excinuclease ABC subunit UvrA [Spiroplasma tabanidicola]|uniref:UvrABC system protein A n=1 Tax=Spiroplasma tabanidicola TaxID=324079 RepID=A0A6I6CC39_9MOLU|nr:excinuclease ABC subunit UvrA [Spiroplasma tabanidicola]QGS51514.1 excinuclease ABC subunit A [Spiroplasma tabanidicola]
MSLDKIIVKGARENNLKNVDITIPKNKLIVFTGLSGSGKSSLAFNTIYAEGERRYIESLSSFSRQFLKSTEKPDVDDIEGLSPAISIDQKTTSHNPRSTVGTTTEIHDHLRLLYANVGTPYCINGHGPIKSQSLKEIINSIKKMTSDNEQIYILSPVVRDKKGTHKDLFSRLQREGFIRVQVNGEIKTLDEEIELEQNKRHDIDIVVDRLVYKVEDEDLQSRLYSAIEIGLTYSNGIIKINYPNKNNETKLYSTKYSCSECGFMIPNLEPNLFSFNKKVGACETCSGLGINLEADPSLIIPDTSLSIKQGGILYYKNLVGTQNLEWQEFKILCDYYLIDMDMPISSLRQKQVDVILYGSDEPLEVTLNSTSGNVFNKMNYTEGLANLIERRYLTTKSEDNRKFYGKFMSSRVCKTCNGKRLNELALSVKLNGLSIADFVELTIENELNFLLNLELTDQQKQIASLVLNQLLSRISFLNEVGLNYLTLARSATTLSGGESQRIRLAKQLGSKLSGVLYVLDEPSIGLHQKDNDKLIATLKKLRDLGNTLIVVEHDEDTMKHSDWIVDIGPGAGVHGGEVVAQGSYDDICNEPRSITGQYLSKKLSIPVPKKRRGGNGKKLEIIQASENNLKNIDVTIPLGKFVTITGVSGSGKSTLMEEIIYKGLRKEVAKELIHPGKYKKMKGTENIDKIIYVSQDPIGKTPRSNPATYTSVFDDIRDLFAETPEAKMRGYKKGRFSFNVPGGRCDACQGDGVVRVDMQFLGYVEVICEVCEGRRYNEETLQVKYKSKNVWDVLSMTVKEAADFFENIPKIKEKLDTILAVGLGYIKLGQNATTLSGGEAQRVKLSTFLLKKSTGQTLFLLDEPTTGLHVDDVNRLIKVLNILVDQGNTVLTIEHNLDFIKVSDYLIDLGPDGGMAGGEILATGTPEQVVLAQNSYTAKYLREYLND